MELKHSYAEYLVKKATQRGLWPWERLFLQAHLAACPDCFHTALGLAEVIHESEVAGLRGKELSLLHQRLMVKVRQEA
jgi:hypothetical protein